MAGLAAAAAQAASADETTISVDSTRQAWRQDESALPPSQVPSINRQFSTAVSGAIYGQPLVVGSMVVVATETDMVYGIDRSTGVIKWSRSVGQPVPPTVLHCGDIGNSYGITSTPVEDPSTGVVYLMALTWDGSNVSSLQWRMFAFQASNGAVQSGWPVSIGGTASNDPTTAFNASVQNQRTGLLLLDGRVYAGFASNCDVGDYRGWVVGVSAGTRSQTRWVDEANPGGGETNIVGGIWQSGGGLAHDPDRPGSIIFASGNGTPPAPGPGTSASNALGQSVVRLQVGTDGTLRAADHFTPFNADQLNSQDLDLGSAGPALLPDGFGGVPNHPHLLFQGSKQGMEYLLDRDNLGGRGQSSDTALAETNGGPVWDHPAVWGGDGGYIYMTQQTSNLQAAPLHVYRVGVDGSGNATLSVVGSTPDSLGRKSGSPVITSDGTTSGSAIMWVVSSVGTRSELRAYNPVPVNGTLQLLKSFPIGTVAGFIEPATDGNQVFVGTADGHLLGFTSGPPAPTPAYTNLALENGWHQAPGTDAPGYMSEGAFVKLRGGLNGGGTGQPIANLPAGLRPKADEWFSVVTASNQVAPLVVHPNGDIVLHAGSPGFLSLSGIVVDVGGSTAYHPLALENGWHAARATYVPGYVQQSGYVELTGGLNGGGVGQPIANLPAGLRPKADEWFSVVTADDQVAPLVVHANGDIVLHAGNPAFLSLSGIAVPVSPPSSGLALENGWRQAPGTDPVAFTQLGSELDLRGGLNGGTTGQAVATLPSGAHADEWFSVVTANNRVAPLVIHNNGDAVLNAGDPGFLSLSGLRSDD
jgi:hypothetical protein